MPTLLALFPSVPSSMAPANSLAQLVLRVPRRLRLSVPSGREMLTRKPMTPRRHSPSVDSFTAADTPTPTLVSIPPRLVQVLSTRLQLVSAPSSQPLPRHGLA